MEVVVAWVAWRPRSHTGAYLVVNVRQRVHQHAVAPCDGLCHNVRPAIMHRVGIRRVEVHRTAGCHLLTCFVPTNPPSTCLTPTPRLASSLLTLLLKSFSPLAPVWSASLLSSAALLLCCPRLLPSPLSILLPPSPRTPLPLLSPALVSLSPPLSLIPSPRPPPLLYSSSGVNTHYSTS